MVIAFSDHVSNDSPSAYISKQMRQIITAELYFKSTIFKKGDISSIITHSILLKPYLSG